MIGIKRSRFYHEEYKQARSCKIFSFILTEDNRLMKPLKQLFLCFILIGVILFLFSCRDKTHKDIRASCGCTVPQWTKRPIPSGESTEIKVQVTPEYEGYFQKKVRMVSNAENPNILFVIKGKVEK